MRKDRTMADELYQKCPICHGTQRLPPDTQVCDYLRELGGRCVCTRSPTPGWSKVGLTLQQVEKIIAERNRLAATMSKL